MKRQGCRVEREGGRRTLFESREWREGSPFRDMGFDKLPEKVRDLSRWASSLAPDLRTAETAEGCIAAAEEAAGGRAKPLGVLPLAVVSTGNQAAGYGELQRHLLGLSKRSRQVVAERSFHSVEVSEPEVVVDAIAVWGRSADPWRFAWRRSRGIWRPGRGRWFYGSAAWTISRKG